VVLKEGPRAYLKVVKVGQFLQIRNKLNIHFYTSMKNKTDISHNPTKGSSHPRLGNTGLNDDLDLTQMAASITAAPA
jgi:hypothetical protein